MRTYLAVFDVPGRMSRFFVFTLVFTLVVEPATEPAAISEIPPQGSGVGVWVVGEVNLGALSLRGVQADS